MAFGLPHDEALKAVTINAGADLGTVADQFGSIEAGKWRRPAVDERRSAGCADEDRTCVHEGAGIELTNKQTRLYEKYMGRQ